jgi:hypothetical protein
VPARISLPLADLPSEGFRKGQRAVALRLAQLNWDESLLALCLYTEMTGSGACATGDRPELPRPGGKSSSFGRQQCRHTHTAMHCTALHSVLEQEKHHKTIEISRMLLLVILS